MRRLITQHATRSVALALVSASAFVCGCDSRPSGVRIDGSSTLFPLTEAVAEQFHKGSPSARITVGISGTGGGFQRFCRGEIDICDASRPIKESEVEACRQGGVEFVELPVAYDGIAIVVNPRNSWATSVSVEELRRLWQPDAQGRVVRWSQVRSDWPDREIHLFGAGVNSGTYDYFTEAVVGREHSSRGDYTSSEDDNVLVQGVANDDLALGFFGLAYFEENRARLKALPVDDGNPANGAGSIAPSSGTVGDGTYQPLSRPLFAYVSKAALDRAEVASFVRFYLENAPRLAREVGYVSLPERAYSLAQERVAAKRTGSLFGGGSQVGVSIDTLLEREQAKGNR